MAMTEAMKEVISFKGYLMTWGLIMISWRLTVRAWMLSIWQRTRCTMQGRSTSMSGSTLFGRFLMRVTSSYKRFMRRRFLLICLPSLFWEWSLHIVRSYSIYFKLPELDGARLDKLRLAWSLGQGYVSNHIGVTQWSQHGTILCLTQIWEIYRCGELWVESVKCC